MDTAPRRRTVLTAVAGGLAATAGCLGGSSSEDGPYDGWLDNANNFEAVVDRTDQTEVQITVGAASGFAFDPAAVRVAPGTQVRWEWAALGGGHNVVEENGVFESDLMTGEGEQFTYTFSEPGVYRYFCTPHRTQGMLGVVEVVEE